MHLKKKHLLNVKERILLDRCVRIERQDVSKIEERELYGSG